MLLRLLFLVCLIFTSYLSMGQTAGQRKPRIPVAKAPDAVPSAGTVHVAGDVRRPTDIVIKGTGSITALQAMATAGGTNPTAKLSRARIIRKGENGSAEIPVDVGGCWREKLQM